MIPPVARALALAALAASSAGCAWLDGDGLREPPPPTTATPTQDGPRYPPLRFAGRVVDALSGDPVPDAQVRLDLAHTLPCERESLVWASWDLPVDAEGAFGPHEAQAPDAPTYRFFLHVASPGYAQESVYIGPENARAAANLTVALHPRASVEGAAPPGTVVALEAPRFPRLAVADAQGRFAFQDARSGEAWLVAATAVPWRQRVAPPAEVAVEPPDGTGWTLRGATKDVDGRPVQADVVAWNGTQLWSAARADAQGRFALPLPPEPVALRIEARTAAGDLGGVLAREVAGPPSLPETVTMRALC